MLLHQARPGFEAWFGQVPKVTPELRRFVLESLVAMVPASLFREGPRPDRLDRHGQDHRRPDARAARRPVHDSDATVHRLLGGGAAPCLIEREFPGSVRDGAVDRAALGAIVFRDTTALRRLEAILHPLVQRSQRRFLASCASRRIPVAVLDIPLLYETGASAASMPSSSSPPARDPARPRAGPAGHDA